MKRQEVELIQIQTYKIYECSKLKYRELQLLLRIEPKTSKVRGRVKPHDRARVAGNSTNFFPGINRFVLIKQIQYWDKRIINILQRFKFVILFYTINTPYAHVLQLSI
ncbi:Hypothetical_protein [Hexamita inflata]|uniref:Hypothetical_protein n=1 Tax=Hexamita inflata TaxID=28002 RepID=A0AA86QDI6_9EUKA|nr:Hypothetical protein HINF_LOCUS37660 [Hexamita inflata]